MGIDVECPALDNVRWCGANAQQVKHLCGRFSQERPAISFHHNEVRLALLPAHWRADILRKRTAGLQWYVAAIGIQLVCCFLLRADADLFRLQCFPRRHRHIVRDGTGVDHGIGELHSSNDQIDTNPHKSTQ